MKKILITGGTGFLAERLIERLYGIYKIVILARNEGKLIALKQHFPNIEIIPGDASVHLAADKACSGIDHIFLLHAFKHVTLAEKHVDTCVRSNILGVLNILENSIGKESIILTSTDKAAQVKGTYGATKLLAENLFKEYNDNYGESTKYRVVRYGNVLDSTGSVSNIWREKIKNGEPVKISNPEATRYFWTRDQAIDLIFECLEKAVDASPYMPNMKAMKMGDMLEAMIQKYSGGKEIKVEVIGLQPSENLHETIDGKTFSNEVELYGINEIKQMI